MSSETENPDHPVLAPKTPFSQGEEVIVNVKGEAMQGKIVEVIETEGKEPSYRVSFGAVATVKQEQLQKAG